MPDRELVLRTDAELWNRTPVLVDLHGKAPALCNQPGAWTDDCWLWTAALGGGGYGNFWTGSRSIVAHRYSYELLVGPVPGGLVLDHLCRVRHCVNPDHLEPVTTKENLLRGDTFQAANVAKTHCPRGHPYSGSNLYVYRDGHRGCRACTAIYRKRRLARSTSDVLDALGGSDE